MNIFFLGMTISFLGSLPLGTMNVTITHLSVQKGIEAGWWFGVGAIAIELLYVQSALVGMKWVLSNQKIYRIFEWLTIIMILIVSFASLHAAITLKSFSGSVSLLFLSPFISGVFLSLINPLHIPFWFTWSSILTEKNILKPGKRYTQLYLAGISMGSMLGFTVFIFSSRFAIEKIKANEPLLNYGIGIILFITAGLQWYKMSQKNSEKKLRPVIM